MVDIARLRPASDSCCFWIMQLDVVQAFLLLPQVLERWPCATFIGVHINPCIAPLHSRLLRRVELSFSQLRRNCFIL